MVAQVVKNLPAMLDTQVQSLGWEDPLVMGYSSPGSRLCMKPRRNCAGKNTGEGYHFLLQGIFLTQELNPNLLHCRQILYRLSYKGRPRTDQVEAGTSGFCS